MIALEQVRNSDDPGVISSRLLRSDEKRKALWDEIKADPRFSSDYLRR
jgi:hypothetical protein